MKNSRGIKTAFLGIAMVSLALFIAVGPAIVAVYGYSGGLYTSYMHEDKKLLEKDFYKSAKFDYGIIRPVTYWLAESVQTEEEYKELETKTDFSSKNEEEEEDLNQWDHNEYIKDMNRKIKNAKEQLGYLTNVRFFAINTKTQKYYSNTELKTKEEFEKNVKGYANIYIKSSSEIDRSTVDTTYIKKIGNETYKGKNLNRNLLDVTYGLEDGVEIYAVFPDTENLIGYDRVQSEYSHYNQTTIFMKYSIILLISTLGVFILATIVYKRIKAKIADKDSLILRIYKKIPLEIIGFLFVISLFVSIVSIINYTYSGGYFGNLYEHIILVFLGIVSVLAILYMEIKRLKSLERKRDLFKSSIIIKVIILLRRTSRKRIYEIKKITKKLPFTKLLILSASVMLAVNILFGLLFLVLGSFILFFITLALPYITLAGFIFYIIKKLAYLSDIMEGAENIKNGKLNYKIKIKDNDSFTTLAENINNIGEGLEASIEDQLRSERMKAELITNVSHDLKTPLTSIINYVELIKKEEDIKPEHIKDYVNILDSKSKRLKVLIEDLFEASKASSGNIELNMEKIDLKQLLRQSIGEMEEKISKANLDLRLNVPEEKVYIKADGKRLYRVLENLLSNITKYSLSNTRVYIELTQDDDKVSLAMKNISSYELNFDPIEIMERFKRADESRNTEGSGLGLSIARDLVSIQGGKFDIEIDGDLFKSILEFNKVQ